MIQYTLSPLVNLAHPRQDIVREREFDLSRNRYRFASTLLPELSPGATLVDVGGGAGEFCLIARERGYTTTLIDGNSRSVENERQRGFNAKQSDLTEGLANVPDESFDVVVSLEVIEHIVTAEQLLGEMARVLKPGGTMVLSTPNFGFLKDRLAYLCGGDAKEEGYHFRFYTRKKLVRMVRAAGLEVERTNSIASAMGLNFTLRMLTLGRVRIQQFASPAWCESWLAATFVWRLRKPAETDL
jgi:methionine biosynthesis protein MetW